MPFFVRLSVTFCPLRCDRRRAINHSIATLSLPPPFPSSISLNDTLLPLPPGSGRCVADGQFQQAVGVTIECRRLDKLEEVITRSPDMVTVVTYALNVCRRHIINRDFRQEVLRLIIKLYESVENPDWVNICMCLMFLDDSTEVAKILHNLLQGSEVRLPFCFVSVPL